MVLSVPERSARKDASTTGSSTDGWSTGPVVSAAAFGLRGARVLLGGGDVSVSGSAAATAFVLGARGVLDRARGGWSDDGGSSSPGGAATGSAAATASLGFRGARTLLGGAAAASAATIWPSICGGRSLFG